MIRQGVLIRGDSLDGAIVATIAYFDVFAFAARPAEIHRFLVGRRASRSDVEHALSNSRALSQVLGFRDGVYFLRGKDHLAPRRQRFGNHSAKLWPEARKIARVVERSGFASCGMVTGSLAADNADEHADIDFLFTYPVNRTWTSYAAVRLLAKMPGLGMNKLCPNYVLSEAALEIKPQNLFTAWEIAKAVPMFGFDVYRAFVHANRWVERYLPNALPMLEAATGPMSTDRSLVRGVTTSAWFQKLESLERRRKFKTDARDVGIDMKSRAERGSMDRHSPTRSFHTLSELRYRMSVSGLEAHPLFAELDRETAFLAVEMKKWGAHEVHASAEANRDVPLVHAKIA